MASKFIQISEYMTFANCSSLGNMVRWRCLKMSEHEWKRNVRQRQRAAIRAGKEVV